MFGVAKGGCGTREGRLGKKGPKPNFWDFMGAAQEIGGWYYSGHNKEGSF